MKRAGEPQEEKTPPARGHGLPLLRLVLFSSFGNRMDRGITRNGHRGIGEGIRT